MPGTVLCTLDASFLHPMKEVLLFVIISPMSQLSEFRWLVQGCTATEKPGFKFSLNLVSALAIRPLGRESSPPFRRNERGPSEQSLEG